MVEYLAEQLDIADPSWVKACTRRTQTAYEHAWEIRDAYGYKVYEDHEMGREFRTFLHGRAWIHAEGPVALFDHAVGWLRRHRVLLPGVHVLARQVSEVRKAAESRLHATVAKATRQVDPALPGQLLALLEIPVGKRWSDLERLRKPPTRNSGSSLAKALHRVEEISAFDLGRLKLAHVPPNRLSALARQAMNSKTSNLGRPSEPKHTALVCNLEAMAIDDALDLFALLMSTKLINPARRGTDKERLAMLPKLEGASRILARASRVLIERLQAVEETQTDLDVAALWAARCAIHRHGRDGYGKLSQCLLSTPKVTSSVVPAST